MTYIDDLYSESILYKFQFRRLESRCTNTKLRRNKFSSKNFSNLRYSLYIEGTKKKFLKEFLQLDIRQIYKSIARSSTIMFIIIVHQSMFILFSPCSLSLFSP